MHNYFNEEVPLEESCLIGLPVAYHNKLNWNSLSLHDININRQHFMKIT